MRAPRVWIAGALVALLVAGGSGAAPPLTPPAASPHVDASDAGAIGAAFDRAFAPDGKRRFTGAVVAVVQDGRTVFLKGYGHENAAGRVPVDPVQTRFRLGSITKTLVGVGIARLIDTGRIPSLDVPVDQVSKVNLSANRGTPVTLRMLGTHQAGLAEGRQPFQRLGEPTPTVDAAYFHAQFPGYVVPANSGSNYSNYGAALLGEVVAESNGTIFPEFARRAVFAPLGMTHSVIVTRPGALPRLADGEVFYPGGGKRVIPNTWANNPANIAAGGLASSGEDIARYMIGLLGGGGDVPALLSPRAQALLFTRQGGTQPLTQGYSVLFMINRWNGERLVEHGGRTLGASSYMSLLPDRRTGIFVAVTGDYGQSLPGATLLGLPAPPPPDKAQAGKTLPGLADIRAIGLEALLGRYRLPIRPQPTAFDPGDYAGQYVGQRRSLASVTQLFSDTFLGGPLTVSPGRPGEILLGRTPFKQIAKDVFWHDPALTPDRPSGWSDILVFRRDAQGHVTDLSQLYTDVVFAKADGLLTPHRASAAVAWGVIILLSGLLSFLWARRSPGRIFAPITALGVLLSPLLFFWSWPKAAVEPLSFVWITPGELALFQLWLDATALLAVVLIVLAVAARRGSGAGWRALLGRWHLRLLALGAASLLVGAGYYHMVGWHVT